MVLLFWFGLLVCLPEICDAGCGAYDRMDDRRHQEGHDVAACDEGREAAH